MKLRTKLAATAALTALALFAAMPAFAGKPHGGGGGGGTSGGGTISLVPLYSHTGAPVIGDWVTFSVSTSASYPYVRVSCLQGTAQVFTQTNGFFPAYPWGQNYQLGPTATWTSGSASCTAMLYTVNSKGGESDLASTSFGVSG